MAVLEPPGEPVEEAAELQTEFGRGLYDVLARGALPFVTLRGIRREDTADVLLIDVEPEMPQDVAADIRPCEPIAIRVYDAEEWTPEVLALRDDFPSDHLHLNVTDAACPWLSLCLYEETWDDLRVHLTPAAFLGRIQDWLSRSARGELHDPDQAVEPFVSPVALPLVLPPSLREEGPPRLLYIHWRGEGRRSVLVVAPPVDGDDTPAHLAFVLRGTPTRPGALHRHPSDVAELHELVRPLGIDLISGLRERLQEVKEGAEDFANTAVAESPVILIFIAPLIREDGAEPEGEQIFAYQVNVPAMELGEAVGVWDRDPDGKLGLLFPVDDSRRGQSTPLFPLRPVFDITSQDAAGLSGTTPQPTRIAAVGVGALGSQLVLNLVRSGFGEWTLIDDDSLLPHNLVRHALWRQAIGFPKADTVRAFASSIFVDGPSVEAVVGNVLRGEAQSEVHDALRASELALDLSASATVARAIALDIDGVPRCISIFMNPAGTDVVALMEDNDRTIKLDGLEMQYYRAVARSPRLAGHLDEPTGSSRYGASCRDVTVHIPQDQVAVAAGIGAHVVRNRSETPDPALQVWRMDADLAVETVAVDVHRVVEWKCGDWTLVSDEWLLQHLSEMRARRLPNETGGVLLGFHDVQRRRLYIVDALPAPPDSNERPVFFDRGCVGLRAEVTRVEGATAGAVSYVGEWHSHPGRSTAASGLDEEVLDHLTTHMARDGLPGVMVIVGETELASFVDSVTNRARQPLELNA